MPSNRSEIERSSASNFASLKKIAASIAQVRRLDNFDETKKDSRFRPRVFLCDHPARSVALSHIKAEKRHADQQQRREIDGTKDEPESPEIFSAHIATAVVNWARAGCIRRDDTHQTERVAKEKRNQSNRHLRHRHG